MRLAALRGFEVVHEYAAHESTAKRRPTFEAMMADARRRQFDVLLVWAIDRFGRSLEGNVRDVLELERLGIRVMSFSESWLDTGPTQPGARSVAEHLLVDRRSRTSSAERTHEGRAGSCSR